MAYYTPCPLCGANLDPGEKCDCEQNKSPVREEAQDETKTNKFTVIIPNNYGYVKEGNLK